MIEKITLVISIISLLLFIALIVYLLLTKKKGSNEIDIDNINSNVTKTMNTLSLSISNLVAEKNSSILLDINHKLEILTENLNKEINIVKDNIDKLINSNNEFNERQIKANNLIKEEISTKLSKDISEFNRVSKETLNDFNKSIKEKLEDFKKNTGEAILKVENTLKDSLTEIRKDNNEKLDKINSSVNEKLEKTLESKLKDSFDNVIKQIGNVNTAVGEIKGLASDVGSLKKVLTNVKTKGILGEVILGNIIREFLTVEQYEENFITKAGSKERVEFAIKLPGNGEGVVYLPIDSKFPYEPYSRILESVDIDEITENRKELRSNLLKYAKDVHDKYIDVPNTTDFAIIFLPLEGLYLEALNMGLFEEIQTKYKVNLTGPTTLSAFINSLQVGFKSLMIEKRSSDIFKLLGAVKTEFNKFAECLERTQKKVTEASNELDTLVGTRTRMINSKLKNIDSLDANESKLLIEEK